MFISLSETITQYKFPIKGVLHLGAHIAEEAEEYVKVGAGEVWWVEANPALIHQLRLNVQPFGHHVIEALIWDVDDVDLDLNVTNNVMSSSVLPLGTHLKVAPMVQYVDKIACTTTTVDSLAARHGIRANYLEMDLQGAELHALQGAEQFLNQVLFIGTEINFDELYVGCVRAHELDAWLEARGFERVKTVMAENDVGWGDCLYRRRV